MLRGALATLLSIEPDIEVLGSFSDGEQALHAVGRYRPNVLVADIEMPKMSGLELTVRVKELYPDTRVLILTTFARPVYPRARRSALIVASVPLETKRTRSTDGSIVQTSWASSVSSRR